MHPRSSKRRVENKLHSIFKTAGICCILAALAFEGHAQISPDPASNAPPSDTSAQHAVALSLPPGTPLQVALDREIRVKRVGQPIQGHLMQPVYAFDHLVLPLGTRVEGRISKIGRPTGKQLTFSILNADFTPLRPIQVSFDQIVLADGTHLPLHATVVPGSGQVIRLVDTGSAKGGNTKNPVSAKMNEAKQEWNQAVQQIKQPGEMHRALRIGIAQLPVHPQYIDAGTLYYADLEQPLNFGSEAVKPQELQSIGTPPPAGSLVRASLVTPLDSGTTKHEAPVEAVVSKPLFDGDRLILPQGTLLHGSVLQVRPARHLKHNGELRIAFHQLELPNGSTFRVDTTLEGIQAGTSETLDSEGAAKATNPRSRYINTGISVSLAMVGSGGKNDVGNAGPAAGGATAFKLVGIVVGLAVRSHTMAILMSAYGGGRSIYVNFFGPGKNISFPRDTTMEIGFGSRSEAPLSAHP
jgi:type IV secretory pathway VirB10-like protein